MEQSGPLERARVESAPSDVVLREIHGLMAARRDADAIALLRDADVRDERILLALAVALWNAGDVEGSQRLLESLRATNPADPAVLRASVWIGDAAGSATLAHAAARSWAADGRETDGASSLAALSVLARDPPGLRAAADAIASADPAEAAVMRGNAALLERRWPAAITEFDHAVQLDPARGQAYLNRSIAWLQAGDARAALRDAVSTVRIEPAAASGVDAVRRTMNRVLAPRRRLAVALAFAALISLNAPNRLAIEQALGAGMLAGVVLTILLLRRRSREMSLEAHKIYGSGGFRLVATAYDVVLGIGLGYVLFFALSVAEGAAGVFGSDRIGGDVTLLLLLAIVVGSVVAVRRWRGRTSFLRWADMRVRFGNQDPTGPSNTGRPRAEPDAALSRDETEPGAGADQIPG